MSTKRSIYSGNGSPSNKTIADAGDLYVDTVGLTLYVKGQGNGDSAGWVAASGLAIQGAPIAITGAKLSDDVVLANLLTALATLGLVTDSTT